MYCEKPGAAERANSDDVTTIAVCHIVLLPRNRLAENDFSGHAGGQQGSDAGGSGGPRGERLEMASETVKLKKADMLRLSSRTSEAICPMTLTAK